MECILRPNRDHGILCWRTSGFHRGHAVLGADGAGWQVVVIDDLADQRGSWVGANLTRRGVARFVPIEIHPIDDETRGQCLALRLLPHEQRFMPDVRSSLELAAKYPQAIPPAIVHRRERVIGFALVGVDGATQLWKLYRLLIDSEQRNCGYGATALNLILGMLRREGCASDILVTYQRDNDIARRLYARFGFVEYGTEGTKVLARKHASV